MSCKAGISKHSSDDGSLELSQLQELWEGGNKEIVTNYVKKHFLGSALQIWLMRTRDAELILAYLTSHRSCGLFEDAEDLLMSLNNNQLRKVYMEQWYLRQSSLLLLFAEKEFALLRRYVAKHPEESFSRMMLRLMFETGDKKLIRQYVRVHPSILEEERYADKLKEFGLISTVSTVR